MRAALLHDEGSGSVARAVARGRPTVGRLLVRIARVGGLAGVSLVAAAALAAPPGSAVVPLRKPNVVLTVSGAGYDRTVVVRITTQAGRPVHRAQVLASAQMRAPGHFMFLAPKVSAEVTAGSYRAHLHFPMLGEWRLEARVSGRGIATVTAHLTVRL